MKIEDVKMEEKSEYAGKYIDADTGVQAVENATDANDLIDKGALPTKFGMWSKVKSFLFQEIGIGKKVVLELSPKEEKVLTEVHDFLFQEISFSGLFSLGKGKKIGNDDETKTQL